MKKFFALILTFLMAITLAGCVEYTEPTPTPPGGSSGQPATPNPGGSTTDDPTADEGDENDFVVRLIAYRTTTPLQIGSQEIYAQWTSQDDNSFHTARFTSRGIARISGLAGDYSIRLSVPPEGYTYDPNIYNADSDNKSVDIIVYPIQKTAADHDGSSILDNDIISVTLTGFYRATLKSPDDELFYQYQPATNGVYYVRSLLSITANEVNPILDVYIKNNGGYNLEDPLWTQDGGSSSNTYTKNFLYEINTRQDEVRSIYAFVIRTTSIDASAFPINIDFVIEREGEFTGNFVEYETKTPQEQLRNIPNVSGTFISAGQANAQASGGARPYILNSDLYKLNPADGYYHEVDSNGNFGRTLYAKISQDNEVFASSQAAEGSENSGGGFTNPMLQRFALRFTSAADNKNYDWINFINAYADCTRNNTDGVYPVTEELKDFLQSYSMNQRLFNDGNGMAEELFASADDDQWLFACGVYI